MLIPVNLIEQESTVQGFDLRFFVCCVASIQNMNHGEKKTIYADDLCKYGHSKNIKLP